MTHTAHTARRPGKGQVEGVPALVAGPEGLADVLEELTVIQEGLEGREPQERQARALVMHTRTLESESGQSERRQRPSEELKLRARQISTPHGERQVPVTENLTFNTSGEAKNKPKGRAGKQEIKCRGKAQT